MRIEIRVNRAQGRRWHRELADRLRLKLDAADVRIGSVEGGAPLPGAVEALLALERIVLRGSRPSPMDRLRPAELGAVATADFTPDVVVDCTGGRAPDRVRSGTITLLRPLYGGLASERALAAALLAGTVPDVAVEDVASGRTVAAGRPGGGAKGLTGGIEAVTSRLSQLVEEAVRSPAGLAPDLGPRSADLRARPVLSYVLRNLATDCARAIFRLAFDTPHWRIGWRLHDGPGVIERGDLGGPSWTVLDDPGRSFFADPFPVTWQGRTVVFFEELDHRIGKGIVSAIAFGPDGPVGRSFPVIEEPWHLSYPFVLEHAGALYMVPEASLSGAVWLYRCTSFPGKWERVGRLIDGIEAADCTLFRHGGRLWMMSATREGAGGYSDTLSIHHAEDLLGPWIAHARQPVLIDVATTRPAGRVVARDGRLWRPVQDCSRGYGRALALAEIDALDTEHFSQTVRHRIAPGPLWPGRALHTLNRAGRLECIDGAIHAPKLAAARRSMEARMRPGGLGSARTFDRTAPSPRST